MFEDSLLDNRIKSKQGWSTVLSFGLQLLLLAVILVVPLFITEELPTAQLVTYLVLPPPPPPPPPPAATVVRKVVKVETDIDDGKLKTPTKIPDKIVKIVEDVAPPPVSAIGGVVGGVPGGIPGGQIGGVIGGIVSSVPLPLPPPPKLIRVSSGVEAGLLVKKVQPNYPSLARQARIQGTVILEATIGTDGSIENLHVTSGHPMLVSAAVDAVKQWKYRPYLLNGLPVEVQTTIQVNFNLQ